MFWTNKVINFRFNPETLLDSANKSVEELLTKEFLHFCAHVNIINCDDKGSDVTIVQYASQLQQAKISR